MVQRLKQLSTWVTNEDKLFRLASLLGVETKTIDSCLTNNPGNINMAAFCVLRHWFDSLEDRDNAKIILDLKKALCTAGMRQVVVEDVEEWS